MTTRSSSVRKNSSSGMAVARMTARRSFSTASMISVAMTKPSGRFPAFCPLEMSSTSLTGTKGSSAIRRGCPLSMAAYIAPKTLPAGFAADLSRWRRRA